MPESTRVLVALGAGLAGGIVIAATGNAALVQSADEALAIPNRVSGFVLPLAVSTFHVAAPVSWPIGALFVGWFYGIPVHAPQLLTVSLAAVFLAFVAPGVPRGSFIMLAPLFMAIGLPVEGIGILIAIDALPDLFATLLNVTGYLAAVAIVGRLDRREPGGGGSGQPLQELNVESGGRTVSSGAPRISLVRRAHP